MHRELGGIAPAADGYERISIAPLISPTYGPSAVNQTVQTVRGRVDSRWVRGGAKGVVLRLNVRVPTATAAIVRLPLLGRKAAEVSVDVDDGEDGGRRVRIWPAGVGAVTMAVLGVQAVEAREGVVAISVLAGEYAFVVTGGK